MAQDRQTDFEVADGGEIVSFQPISSAARQWCIDAMPDDAKATSDGYLIRQPSAAKVLAQLRADAFTISEVSANG